MGLLACHTGAPAPAPAALPGPPSVRPAAVVRAGTVHPGIDVLLSDSIALVRGRRVGLVTNQTGVDAQGLSDIARLQNAGIGLVALFSPEHGFRGAAPPGASVASSIDSATGLPIYSLYGATSAPTDAMLHDVDILLVDLQDSGARYYTYLATTVDVIRSAAAHGIPVVVLDRPDPIGGLVQGNVLDPNYSSAVGLLAVPMRHGMTLGELTLLAKADLQLPGQVIVVPVEGWVRHEPYDSTGLRFVPPSPNLRSLDALFDYPGLCLFEGTALSVGRGTDDPFTLIGAPWLDTTAVLARLRQASLPGVAFRSDTVTPHAPGDGKFADTTLRAIRLVVTDRSRYDPTSTAVHLLAAVEAYQPDRIGWHPAQFDRLAGGPVLRQAVTALADPAAIVASWGDAQRRFLARRKPFLLYRE